MNNFRIGYGEDAHALETGRRLVIGGVEITDSLHGAVAHSDGDVLLHALSDALLSCFALGDIGKYYPPSDPQYRDMDSVDILLGIQKIINDCTPDWKIHNIAAVVTLDTPKLGKKREEISGRLATILGLNTAQVGITFKTSEGLAPQHIQARVSLLLHVT